MSIGGAVTTGGVTPGSVRAGGAHVEFSAKDHVSPQAKKIKKNLDDIGPSVDSLGKKWVQGFGGMGLSALRGGIIGGIIGGSLQSAIQGGVKELTNLVLGMDKVEAATQRAVGRAAELNKQLQESNDRRDNSVLGQIKAMGDDPASAIGKATPAIEKLKQELDGARRNAESLQKTFDSFTPTSSVDNAQQFLSPWGDFEKMKQGLHGDPLEAAKTRVQGLTKALKELEAERQKLRNPGPDLALGGDAKKMLDDLEFAGRTRGMSAERIALEKLRDRESKSMRQGGKSADLGRIEERIKDKEFVDELERPKPPDQTHPLLQAAIRAAATIASNPDILGAVDRHRQVDFKKFTDALRPPDIGRMVSGGFASPVAGQQFSIADRNIKEQTDILKQINTGVGGIGSQVLNALKVLG